MTDAPTTHTEILDRIRADFERFEAAGDRSRSAIALEYLARANGRTEDEEAQRAGITLRRVMEELLSVAHAEAQSANASPGDQRSAWRLIERITGCCGLRPAEHAA